jgi:hypothetical protein
MTRPLREAVPYQCEAFHYLRINAVQGSTFGMKPVKFREHDTVSARGKEVEIVVSFRDEQFVRKKCTDVGEEKPAGSFWRFCFPFIRLT